MSDLFLIASTVAPISQEVFTTMDTLTLSVVGFGIVFCVLAIIFLTLLAMQAVFYKKPAPVPKSAPIAQEAIAEVEMSEEDEIAAVVAIVNAIITEENTGWRPTFKNNIGGNVNEKLYSKDKWKSI